MTGSALQVWKVFGRDEESETALVIAKGGGLLEAVITSRDSEVKIVAV